MGTANLPAHARRSGRAGTAWLDGQKLGEVVAVEWTVEIEQMSVPIPGSYRDGTKAGGEQYRGSLRWQDVHDRWKLIVLDFLDARRRGDRAAAAAVPKFDVVLKIDDIGAPHPTRESLHGIEMFQAEGGFGTDDEILTRDTPFSFDYVKIDGFVYLPNGETKLETRI